jgi:hypothetical protein
MAAVEAGGGTVAVVASKIFSMNAKLDQIIQLSHQLVGFFFKFSVNSQLHVLKRFFVIVMLYS